MKNNKKRIWTIVSIVLIGTFLCTTIVFGTQAASAKQQYIQMEEMQGQAAFYTFLDNLSSLSTSTAKAAAGINSALFTQLTGQVYKDANACVNSMLGLNVNEDNKEELTAFLNRVADYSGQLFKKEGDFSEEEKRQVQQISTYCDAIYKRIEEAWAGGYEPTLELSGYLEQMPDAGDFTAQDYPRLTYDGAYSESMEHTPVNLQKEVVTQQEAHKIAESFLQVPLTFSYELGAEQPQYIFAGIHEEQPVEIAVAKHGGEILSFLTQATEDGLDIVPTQKRAEEIIKIAETYLQKKGWPACESGYVQYYGGNAIVNLIPLEQGIRIYPDLIKVWVNMNTNAIMGVDANNYVASHKNRALDEPAISLEEAKKSISGLTLNEYDFAVIPLPSGAEQFCFEFWCTLGEDDYIIYVDAATGEVADILQIVHTNNGTLTK